VKLRDDCAPSDFVSTARALAAMRSGAIHKPAEKLRSLIMRVTWQREPCVPSSTNRELKGMISAEPRPELKTPATFGPPAKFIVSGAGEG
jgi:hypothetical protein